MGLVSRELTAWSEAMDEGGTPAGMLHWDEVGQGPLCGKPGGLYATDLDMNSALALAAAQKTGYGAYPCAACCERYRDGHPV